MADKVKTPVDLTLDEIKAREQRVADELATRSQGGEPDPTPSIAVETESASESESA